MIYYTELYYNLITCHFAFSKIVKKKIFSFKKKNLKGSESYLLQDAICHYICFPLIFRYLCG